MTPWAVSKLQGLPHPKHVQDDCISAVIIFNSGWTSLKSLLKWWVDEAFSWECHDRSLFQSPTQCWSNFLSHSLSQGANVTGAFQNPWTISSWHPLPNGSTWCLVWHWNDHWSNIEIASRTHPQEEVRRYTACLWVKVGHPSNIPNWMVNHYHTTICCHLVFLLLAPLCPMNCTWLVSSEFDIVLNQSWRFTRVQQLLYLFSTLLN